jgi:hypothetical protein
MLVSDLKPGGCPGLQPNQSLTDAAVDHEPGANILAVKQPSLHATDESADRSQRRRSAALSMSSREARVDIPRSVTSGGRGPAHLSSVRSLPGVASSSSAPVCLARRLAPCPRWLVDSS